VQPAQTQLINAAQTVGQKPYVAYTGARVAGPSSTQTMGADAIRANATSSAWRPGMDQATALVTEGAGATDIAGLLSKVAALQNPFEDQVVGRTMSDMRREGDIAQRDQRLRARGSSSDIRNLFMETELERNLTDRMGATAGGLRSSGFDRTLQSAIGIDSADKGRALAGGGSLAALTSQIDALGKGDAETLYGLGRDDTAREQMKLDTDFAEFLRSQGWDGAQLAAWADAFNKAQLQPTSTTTSKTSTGIGGLLQGVGALGGLAAFSDRRLKRDCAPIGRDARGRQWWLFRYLWDAPGVRRLGVMAQEILGTDPGAVARHPSGFLMVNYSALGA
jgi:hypothetical protein